MSLRLTPAAGHATSTSNSKTSLAPSAPVHDTLRAGPSNIASSINNQHPLQHRLQNWSTTQEATRLESMRRIYGIAEPLRREMEMLHCSEGNVHTGYRFEDGVGLDILRGTDCKIDVDDIWKSREMARGEEYSEVMEKLMLRN